MTLVQLSYQWYHEIMHIMAKDFKENFRLGSISNNTVWLILCTIIVICSIPSEPWIPLQYMVVISSWVTFLMMFKVLLWMRMFDKTSFYIQLILQTLKDITAFLLLLVISLFILGLPMLMLNMNRVNDEDGLVVDEPFEKRYLNMLVNQYLLALGEFSMDGFEGQPQEACCYILFIMATFFTQLTMLNMLIAIMGDTYARVMDNKELYRVKTKLAITSELSSNFFRVSREADHKVFLFVVTPDDVGQEEADEWQGSISEMSKFTEK